MTRLDAMEEQGITYLDRFPVADYEEVWDRIMFNEDGLPSDLLFYVEGVQESVDLFEYSKPDIDKWLPGNKAFWEWVGNDDNDYWTKINEGTITPDVFAQQWEDKINEFIATALDEYE
jgi:multiple sugar transport system substrate-binding protein